MAFDSGVANPGSGGLVFALDTFTDTDLVSRTMPYSALAFGALNGPYTVVTATVGLPVQPQTGSTWTVTASALPLPTGASTAGNQTTGNASLSSIDGKTPALGQALAAGSVPVVLTAAQLAALTPLTSVAVTGTVAVSDAAQLPAALGQTTMAASLPVVLASNQASIPVASTLQAGEAHVGAIGGHVVAPSATFSRPADTTAYTSGDLVANSTTAGSVVPLSWTVARVTAGSGIIRRARLRKSGTTVTNASFRLHLYASSPTPTNGDNVAWLTTQSTYLGSIDLDMSGANGRVFSDAAEVFGVPNVGSELSFALASGQAVYGLVEARGAYTPVSGETFVCDLEVWQS